MKYINSKNEEPNLESLNDFHLMGAAKKADEILNFFNGMTARGDHSIFGNENWAYVERYIRIVHLNLWEEVQRRELENPLKAHFQETFRHLNDSEKVALWNFMKTNFIPKPKEK